MKVRTIREKNEIESESEVRSEPLDMITTCNTSDSKERQEKKNGNIFDLKCYLKCERFRALKSCISGNLHQAVIFCQL